MIYELRRKAFQIGHNSGFTLRRIPLTVDNARVRDKITLNFIKHQIF